MKHSKWTVLISSVFMQMVLGIIYIWGVFQPEVALHYGWSTPVSAAVFSVMIVFIITGSILGGKLQDIYSPRPVILISGVFVSIGAFLASFTKSSPIWMYFSYGGLSGIGIGAIYTTTIAAAQKWFKEKSPLATGIILGALGFGGVVFTPVAQFLLSHYGVPGTFRALSIIYFIICIGGGVFIVNPAAYEEINKGEKSAFLKGMSNKEMLGQPMYYILTAAMMFSLPAFFMMAPILKVLCLERGVSEKVSAYAVMSVALLNCVGRFVSPVISKRIGDKNTLVLLNVVTAASSIGMAFSYGWLCILFMCLIAVCFGGVFGVFPSMTSKLFGMKNAASNYGFVLIGYGISAIFAPGIYGITVPLGRYAPFITVAVISIAAVIISRFIGENYLGEGAV